jgi:hypothetical protein
MSHHFALCRLSQSEIGSLVVGGADEHMRAEEVSHQGDAIMKIPNIRAAEYRNPDRNTIRNERRVEETVPDGTTKVSISATSNEMAKKGDGASITDIMSGTSLRNIRYSELVAVANRLKDAGFLAEQDYLDFIGPSPEFASVDGSANPKWDEPTDYLGRHENNLASLVSAGAPQHQIDFEKHMLGLFRLFESGRRGS